MKLYRPGDRSRAICTRCGSVVPTTFSACDVPLSDGGGAVKGVLAATCDCCGSVIALPVQSTPAIAASLDALRPRETRQEREEKQERALHKKVLTLLGAKDGPEAIRIVRNFERAEAVTDKIRLLIGFLSGTPLAELCDRYRTRLSDARFTINRATKEIRNELEHRKFKEACPAYLGDSILARLAPRTINTLKAAGLETDAQVIEHLRGCGGVPLEGAKGVGKVTRREILEAYGELY